MDYGRIEIEKIKNVDSFVNYILSTDWIYSEQEKAVLKYERKNSYEYFISDFEEASSRSVLSEKSFAERYIKEKAELNLFSERTYEAVLNGGVYVDYSKIDAGTIGGFCGRLDALNYLVVIANEPDNIGGVAKIKWTRPKAELISLFYDLVENGLIKVRHKTQMYRFIQNNFIDAHGKEFTKSYIEQLFKPDSIEERSKKRVDLRELLS